MIGEILLAARQIKEQKRKQAEYDRLVGAELNYTILRDLVNSARFDVRIHLTMKDGVQLDIVREDKFDRFQRAPSDLY